MLLCKVGRGGDREVITFDNLKNETFHSYLPLDFSAWNCFRCGECHFVLTTLMITLLFVVESHPHLQDDRFKLRQVHTLLQQCWLQLAVVQPTRTWPGN